MAKIGQSPDKRVATDAWEHPQGNLVESYPFKYITTSTTTAIVASGNCVFRAINITKDVDGGTWSVTDKDDTVLFGGITDHVGSWTFMARSTNGLKLVTTSTTGIQMVATYS